MVQHVVLKAVAVTQVVLKVIVVQRVVLKAVAVTLVVLKVVVMPVALKVTEEQDVLKAEVLKVLTAAVEEPNSRVPLNLKVHLNASKRINIKLPNNTLRS